MWKIGFENFVHRLKLFNLCQKNRQLQDAVHGPATCFDQSLHVVQDFRGVRLGIGWEFFLRIAGVRTLPGDIDNSVVHDQGRNKSGAIGRLSVVTEFADTAPVLCNCWGGCSTSCATEEPGRSHAGEYTSDSRCKASARG